MNQLTLRLYIYFLIARIWLLEHFLSSLSFIITLSLLLKHSGLKRDKNKIYN